ncbi:glycosyltransferase family 2 protein, partial [Burkholderia sp. SIMBA_051]
LQAYRLTNPWARLMVGVMWPLGYALYRRDRRRGVA